MYTPSETDLETYKKLNPSWAEQRGSSTSSWSENEHEAAWLCSPSQWTTYCDTSKASYAIGSPPVEMYVASYNQVSHTTGNYTLGATYGYRGTDYPGYIYTVKETQQNSEHWTNSNTLDYTGYNSMYCGKNGSTGSYFWWLASPSAKSFIYVCLVNGNTANLYLDDRKNAERYLPTSRSKTRSRSRTRKRNRNNRRRNHSRKPTKLLRKENIKLHSRRANIQNILCRQAK